MFIIPIYVTFEVYALLYNLSASLSSHRCVCFTIYVTFEVYASFYNLSASLSHIDVYLFDCTCVGGNVHLGNRLLSRIHHFRIEWN